MQSIHGSIAANKLHIHSTFENYLDVVTKGFVSGDQLLRVMLHFRFPDLECLSFNGDILEVWLFRGNILLHGL